MGGVCPSGMAVTVSVEVKAPSEVVWEVLTDLDALSSILTAVTGVKRISGGSFEVGTKILETRVYKSTEITLQKSVTGITKNPLSVSFNSDFDDNKEHPGMQDICNTSSLTVLPVTDDSCELLGSFAVASPWLSTRLWFCLIALCGITRPRQMFVMELEEYAAAATNRVSKQAQ